MDPTWTAVDQYFDTRLQFEDAVLRAALADSAAAGLPDIAVAPNQARLLHLFASMLGARRILEVGTLGGYSAIALARALPAGDPAARLVTLEFDPRHAAVARANLARAGLAGCTEVRVGAAIETLPVLAAEGGPPFDLAFIDADKPNNPAYFDWALKLVRPGGLIIVDNVVRRGAVADAASADPAVLGTRALFDRLANEPRVLATAVQTVGVKGHDGLVVARVQP